MVSMGFSVWYVGQRYVTLYDMHRDDFVPSPRGGSVPFV